nr:PREDICTED: ankyrin repeat domain-containing protein 34B-like [Latimeria chalumnae]|eukprot:XP_005993229.1 PREDICTED: ankyrin repeat domain-containing protein 34B-like [Latimeria chalumnae]
MEKPKEFLCDENPLQRAASLGKLRLVRLLVDGGAQVNERNEKGETALIASCKLKPEKHQSFSMVKMVKYLLENRADPNIQDKQGKTALMHACIENAGPEVASLLINSGADPSMEDYAGASALVYALNSKDKQTTKVLLDACKARGRDVIIIAKGKTSSGRKITKQYLNVPPSPDCDGHSSPVGCMSPSDIELKTGSPNYDVNEENIFDFKGVDKIVSPEGNWASGLATPPRKDDEAQNKSRPHQLQRLQSEPWLAIHYLSDKTRSSDEENDHSPVEQGCPLKINNGTVLRRRSLSRGVSMDAAEGQPSEHSHFSLKGSLSRTSRKSSDNLPSLTKALTFWRRNTLPTVQDKDLLQLPYLLNGRKRMTGDQYCSDSNLPSDPIPEEYEINKLNKKNAHPTSLTQSPLSHSRQSLPETAIDLTCKKKTNFSESYSSGLAVSEDSPGFLPSLKGSSTVQLCTPTSTQLTNTLTDIPRPPLSSLSNSTKITGVRAKKMLRRHSIQVEQMKQLNNYEQIITQ